MRYRWRQLVSWPVLSALLGLVLLAAVALKGHEVATEELLENGLLSSRWFLMLVVEWELFFALWLLGGFHRLYPRMTQWAALLYFFALFVVAVDSILKGHPSCPCLGKAIMPPWIPAAFDLMALVLLASAPLPSVFCEPRQGYRWFGLAAVFSVFGLLSLITMEDYSTSPPIPTIRRDPRLFVGVVTIQRVRPTIEEMLALIRNTTGLDLSVDERLQNRQPDYGVWDLKAIQPWTVMELLVARQTIPARWKKVDGGYIMVPAARFGKSRLFWFGSAVLLALSMISLRWLEIVQERKKRLSRDTEVEMPSVAGLRATRC